MFGSGNKDSSPFGGGSIFDSNSGNDNKSVFDNVFSSGSSSVFGGGNSSKSPFEASSGMTSAFGDNKKSSLSPFEAGSGVGSVFGNESKESNSSPFEVKSGGMSEAFNSDSGSVFGGENMNKKFEARGMELGNEDKYKASYLVGDSTLASLNVRGGNYGGMDVLDRMRGVQANHLNNETGSVSLAEQYSDASLDKRAMDGMYNTSLSDIYSDKTKYAAHHGLMTDGMVDIVDTTYNVDTYAQEKKETNTMWGSDYDFDLDKTLKFGLDEPKEGGPINQMYYQKAREEKKSIFDVGQNRASENIFKRETTNDSVFDNNEESSVFDNNNSTSSPKNDKYNKIMEENYQKKKEKKKQLKREKGEAYMKEILSKFDKKEEDTTEVKKERDILNYNHKSRADTSVSFEEKTTTSNQEAPQHKIIEKKEELPLFTGEDSYQKRVIDKKAEMMAKIRAKANN